MTDDRPVGLSEDESDQLHRANASERSPVVLVHGLWLLGSSWNRWIRHFDAAGYSAVAPEWPGDPPTVAAARSDPSDLAGTSIGEVAEHLELFVRRLARKPVIIGHSFGGLLTQILAGRGLAAASVVIDPAPHRGVLALPISSLKSAAPVLRNPLNHRRAVALTFEQFRYAFANAVDESEARRLYEEFSVAAPGRPLFQAALANLNPWTAAKVDTKNPARGPMLIISGERDNTIPLAIARATFQRQRRNQGVTEFSEIPGRGHSLTIDNGWQEVADTALDFLGRVELNMAEQRGTDFVQSLARGLAVIRSFDGENPRLTLSDVSRRTGLTRAAARRFLLTLVELGYVHHDGREFSLRPSVLDLGFAYLSSMGLPEVAMPHMETLVAAVQESSSMSVLDGDSIVYVARVPTRRRIMTVAIAVGTRFPAFATSMGRVLLAGLSPADLDVALAKLDLHAYTESTVHGIGELRAAIDLARERGYSIVDQELEHGLRSVAAPVRDEAGTVIAAVNVSVHASRATIDDIEAKFVPQLLAVVGRISSDFSSLGSHPPDRR